MKYSMRKHQFLFVPAKRAQKNLDTNRALRDKYGYTQIPVFAFDSSGVDKIGLVSAIVGLGGFLSKLAGEIAKCAFAF